MTCPIARLDRSRADQIPLDSSIDELDRLGVSPTTFLSEEGDRYVSIQNECTPEQISQFTDYQARLSDRVAAMSAGDIAQRLRDLYHAAYRYNPSDRTVSVVDPEAKRDLDLWIAVINHRAFRDEAFLSRLMGERDIPLFITLNSPNLTPADRGAFFRSVRRLATPRAIYEEGLPSLFHFLRTYDGQVPFFETPYLRSSMEFDAALRLIYPPEELTRMRREAFSPERVRQCVAEAGLQDQYRQLEGLSDEVLLARVQDLGGLMQSNPPRELMRNLAVETSLLNLVFSSRGRDYETEFREATIQDLMKL